jgi:cellulose synthase/poly-beta-1,6-N-acetylglucosamine synthase-like glycosyltransferase
MNFPKILIFTPIYDGKDYSINTFVKHLKELKYPKDRYRHIFVDNSKDETYVSSLRKRFPEFDFHYVGRGNNTREALARAQNYARKIMLDGDYSYLMSIESDIYFPPDTIYRLLKHGKTVISAYYDIGDRSKGIRHPVFTVPDFSKELNAYGTRLLTIQEVPQYRNNGLKKVQAAGMGCCLMHRDAVKLHAFYYDPRFNAHSDVYFFNKMFEHQIEVFADTDLYCEHMNSDWKKVQDR